MIAFVDDCKSVPATINGQTDQTITIGVGSGIFVLLVGVTLNFIATSIALLTPYGCCRMFGKCQHRGWRLPLCIGIPLGICTGFIVFAVEVYSIFVGLSFYPLTQEEFEIPDSCRIPYYSTFIFVLITHVVSSFLIAAFIIAILIALVFVLIKCTICT